MFLDNLLSGASLRGASNWVWAELPRGFLVNHAMFETGHVAEAKAGFDKLLAIPAVSANGDIYWLILYDRGRIALREGNLDEAIEFFRRAIEVIEEQRASINTEAAKIGFVGDKQAVYGQLVAALLQTNRNDLAFEYVERAKSRALVDLLATRDDIAVRGNSSARAAALLAQLGEADREARIEAPVELTRSGEARSSGKAKKLREELTSLSPELASVVSVSALGAKDVQARLQPDEAVLEYYLQGADLYALTVARGSVKALRLDTAGLDQMVQDFRTELQNRGARAQALGRALYDRLIRPLEPQLQAHNLLLIPHGVLHYVSFAALNDGRDYWIANRNLRYLPSASVIRFLRPAGARLPANALAIGNPDLGDAKYDLPSAEREARAITAMIPGSIALTRGQATETRFRQLAPTHPILHIASHGEYNADKALQSRLLLARDDSNDGSLTTGELYALRLDADLVTLSACETGLGAIRSGDDVVGLTRGFLYAGASNIIASLWEVDDDSTQLLMQKFYAGLKNGINKRDALRAAQLEVRKQYPHPFYWAAFFLTGHGA